jgi:glycosyltransferase involved in cell wall biosynthesis
MRILIFSTIFPPAIGGPATQSFHLCKALVKKGVTPIVVTYGPDFSVDRTHGFSVHHFRSVYTHTPLDKALRWIVFPFFIQRLLKREKIDVLHCNSASALSFVAARVAKSMGIPRVLKFAGDWVWETLSTHKLTDAADFTEIYTSSVYARLLTRVEKWGVGLFDAVWTPSQFRRRNIAYLTGASEKTVIIPNCLLLEDGGARTWSESDPVTIISANRFIPHKRIGMIVELFAELALPNSTLVLVGGGAEKEEQAVRDTITRLGLADRVKMTGILSSPEVYEEFEKASFYISMSLEEGFPNVFIEAMHYGLPIVSTDVGGSSELVVEGETGFLLNVDDRSGFIEKMRILGQDVSLRSRMSQNAFERSKLFNLEHRIEDFIALYRRLQNI